MPGKRIFLFMWGYQHSFRISLQILSTNVLSKLGADCETEVLLVGSRAPGSTNRNLVCIEPEYEKWSLSLFNNLSSSIELKYKNHRLQNMFYGDEESMNDKPEWMRRDSTRMAVSEALKPYDQANDVVSFCGESRRIEDYYVTPVIQVPAAVFSRFPPLAHMPTGEREQGYGFRSLIHAAIDTVLDEATTLLETPQPGRNFTGNTRNPDEIVRASARRFLYTPGLSIDRRYIHTELFNTLDLVSSLLYEGSKGIGDLIIVDPKNEAIEFAITFVSPIPLTEPRWVRKVLQMAANGTGIISDYRSIYGLGKLKDSHDPARQDAFVVTFLDHYHWELGCGKHSLIRSHYGSPTLPQEPFDKAAFLASYARIFETSSPDNGLHAWSLLKAQASQGHGSMIAFTEDASGEAMRLSKQGTPINPTFLTKELLRSVSGIDGTILLDPEGYCHAIGVILDGDASEECMPSRGSRYNSGVRYVYTKQKKRLAIIVSDDHTIDVVPPLRKLISRALIERHIATLEASSLDSFHGSRYWLDRHRFYLNPIQCNRINAALYRLDNSPSEDLQIFFPIDSFEASPDMDESYLVE